MGRAATCTCSKDRASWYIDIQLLIVRQHCKTFCFEYQLIHVSKLTVLHSAKFNYGLVAFPKKWRQNKNLQLQNYCSYICVCDNFYSDTLYFCEEAFTTTDNEPNGYTVACRHPVNQRSALKLAAILSKVAKNIHWTRHTIQNMFLKPSQWGLHCITLQS